MTLVVGRDKMPKSVVKVRIFQRRDPQVGSLFLELNLLKGYIFGKLSHKNALTKFHSPFSLNYLMVY